MPNGGRSNITDAGIRPNNAGDAIEDDDDAAVDGGRGGEEAAGGEVGE